MNIILNKPRVKKKQQPEIGDIFISIKTEKRGVKYDLMLINNKLQFIEFRFVEQCENTIGVEIKKTEKKITNGK